MVNYGNLVILPRELVNDRKFLLLATLDGILCLRRARGGAAITAVLSQTSARGPNKLSLKRRRWRFTEVPAPF